MRRYEFDLSHLTWTWGPAVTFSETTTSINKTVELKFETSSKWRHVLRAYYKFLIKVWKMVLQILKNPIEKLNESDWKLIKDALGM